MPSAKEILFGGKDKIKQAKTLTPEQEQLISLISEGLTSGNGPFADIFNFNQKEFDEGVSQPALKNFQDNILPQLNEKFIAGNQVLGSGMRRGQLKAAGDLQSQLAALMYQAKQDTQKNKLAGLQTSLGTKGFENIYKQGSEGLVQGAVKGLAQGAGQALGGGAFNFGGGNAAQGAKQYDNEFRRTGVPIAG